MFPYYDRLALDLEHERRRDAAGEHLARLARSARAPRGSSPSRLRDVRLAAGIALVHAGEAILPREDSQRHSSHPAA